MALAVTVAGSGDPLRDDLAPDTVLSAGRRILAAMVDCLPSLGTEPPRHSPLATRLWSKLSGEPAAEADLRILNAALVLSLDHDLAASTFAARVAASARADPYSAIGAALGAFNSVLHGGASILAVDLLSDVLLHHCPEAALRRQMSSTTGIPGFGHVLYSQRDPRAQHLFALMNAEPSYSAGVDAARQVISVVRARTTRIANIDLALAALAVSRGLRPDSGQAIFAVGRTVGWIAHIVAEYAEPPLRLRPASRYVGRTAAQMDN
jgi:citrate synthase